MAVSRKKPPSGSPSRHKRLRFGITTYFSALDSAMAPSSSARHPASFPSRPQFSAHLSFHRRNARFSPACQRYRIVESQKTASCTPTPPPLVSPREYPGRAHATCRRPVPLTRLQTPATKSLSPGTGRVLLFCRGPFCVPGASATNPFAFHPIPCYTLVAADHLLAFTRPGAQGNCVE
jgi:hypothetical protein